MNSHEIYVKCDINNACDVNDIQNTVIQTNLITFGNKQNTELTQVKVNEA